MSRPCIDLAGKRFGKLVATNRIKDRKRLCCCDCGKKKWVNTGALTSNGLKSCGCIRQFAIDNAARSRVKTSYILHARNRNLSWCLTDDQFDALTSGLCFFCQRAPSNKTRDFVYSGIDRLDNAIGYTFKNCVSCCSICNKAKRNMQLRDFKNWIKDLIRANT